MTPKLHLYKIPVTHRVSFTFAAEVLARSPQEARRLAVDPSSGFTCGGYNWDSMEFHSTKAGAAELVPDPVGDVPEAPAPESVTP